MRDAFRRLPWLFILFFMGLTVSSLVKRFEWIVSEMPVIVAFQSLILGMAGNIGTQALAITVRDAAKRSSGSFSKGRYLSLLAKEVRTDFICGAAIGGFSVLAVFLYLYLLSGADVHTALSVALCVGGAMVISMEISGAMGVIIPCLLRSLGIDPAIASGPLITTISDITAVISYYGSIILFMTK